MESLFGIAGKMFPCSCCCIPPCFFQQNYAEISRIAKDDRFGLKLSFDAKESKFMVNNKEKLCILKDVKTAICAIEFLLQYKYKLVSLWQIIANRKFG